MSPSQRWRPRADHLILLGEMDPGRSGIVVEVIVGRGLCQKLQAMGIRTGSRIRRIAGAFSQGPVVVEAGGAQFAVGFGMAQKIIVELEDAGKSAAGR